MTPLAELRTQLNDHGAPDFAWAVEYESVFASLWETEPNPGVLAFVAGMVDITRTRSALHALLAELSDVHHVGASSEMADAWLSDALTDLVSKARCCAGCFVTFEPVGGRCPECGYLNARADVHVLESVINSATNALAHERGEVMSEDRDARTADAEAIVAARFRALLEWVPPFHGLLQ